MFVTALNSLLLDVSCRKLTCAIAQPCPYALIMLFHTFEMSVDEVFQSKEIINWRQQFLLSSLKYIHGVIYTNHA